MGREHRLETQAAEDGARSACVEAGVAQAADGVEEAAGLRRAGAQVVAAAPQAVDAFGQVDDLEVGREGAHQGLGVVRRASGERGLERRRGVGVAFAAADGGHARGLDVAEEGVAALLAQDLAHQGSERAHVVA